ncbi:CPBP family intramembrane glutamic endopeptidase [Brevibacillus nitrificans]|uniref:CPBP family intramembrane glutamic endopeptidase n=1 Tax=Brevibacillus nitrificans TaxID=651560 RepID=UPI0028648872|nr:CPBP family intramembrane glutamic endopeptidase [Brevibacillus nitrificans]MDR7316620.1 hypothetical protein [Brevibacillus nitrificans]
MDAVYYLIDRAPEEAKNNLRQLLAITRAGLDEVRSYHSEGCLAGRAAVRLDRPVSIGILFGYVRIVMRSVWPAAIMHVVHNIAWAYFHEFTSVTAPGHVSLYRR